MPTPLFAIVGSPNAGKSTLFNRLIGRRKAIVTDEPGVTRDRLYGELPDHSRRIRVVDTGGLTLDRSAPYASEIERQADSALSEAAAALLVVDARAGVTGLDHELAAMLRRRGLPVLLVASKVDGPVAEVGAAELSELGFGAPLQVSAEHDRGIGELIAALDRLLDERPRQEEEPERETGPSWLSVAIVGRPNVGKSSLVNHLLGEERVLVSETAGTTRDAVDTRLEIDGRRYLLIDTAGIRRPGKAARGVERFSLKRARQSIERCDVAVLVLDASEEPAAQDAHIAGRIRDAYKPMVVVLNKWDRVTDRERAAKEWGARLEHLLRFAPGPVTPVLASALSGQRVLRILDRVDELNAEAGIRVPTAELNRWLQQTAAGDRSAPPARGNLRLFYATQTGIRPPSFVIFCNDPSLIHFSVRRQLENRLRAGFGFGAAPLRLRFRGRRDSVAP